MSSINPTLRLAGVYLEFGHLSGSSADDDGAEGPAGIQLLDMESACLPTHLRNDRFHAVVDRRESG